MTNTRDDGGLAFPMASDLLGHAPGMSLRDWFAGNAPPMPDEWPLTLFAGPAPASTIFPYSGPPMTPKELMEMDKEARRAYHIWTARAEATWRWAYADAMLAERNSHD